MRSGCPSGAARDQAPGGVAHRASYAAYANQGSSGVVATDDDDRYVSAEGPYSEGLYESLYEGPYSEGLYEGLYDAQQAFAAFALVLYMFFVLSHLCMCFFQIPGSKYKNRNHDEMVVQE